MDNISRKDIDRAAQILQNHVGTPEAIKLAGILEEADIIPKLYAYTYFKKVKDEFNQLEVAKKSFDFEELETLKENVDGLQLEGIRNKREARIVNNILSNGFEREGKFCDFNDATNHGKTMKGNCTNEYHESDIKVETLFPIYDADEETRKMVETEEWWCKGCCDNSDGWQGDFNISCDMDLDE